MFDVLKWLSLSCLLASCSVLVDADPDRLGQPGGDAQDMDPATGDGDGGIDPGYDSGCGSCDDGDACTRDSCAGGSCQHEVDPDQCEEGERCQPGRGCVPKRCTESAQCDDGNPCNGQETCDPGAAGADAKSGCVAGGPLDCADIVPCTTDRCDPQVGCVHDVDDAACGDGVDCTVDKCDAVLGCRHEPSQERCDACRIASYCDATLGCLGGIARSCSDGDLCTVDSCSVEQAMCLHEPSPDCDFVAPDICAEAQEITITNGVGEVRGSLLDVAPSYDTGCGASGARDAVYKIHVGYVADIILDTAGSSARTVLAVAPELCGSQGFEFGCAGAVGGSLTNTRLVLHNYDPAEHGEDLYVLVDGATAGETGDYVLGVEVWGASFDTCEQPLYLTECATVMGFIPDRQPANAWGVQRGNCQSGGGASRAPEATFSIPGAADGSVSLSVSSDDFVPALYARTICDSRDNDVQLGCENSFSTNGQSGGADFNISLGQSERAFVLVDNGRNRGKYTLRCVP
jgi:hypothetical protein